MTSTTSTRDAAVRRRSARAVIAALAVATLTISGCGDGTSSSNTTSTPESRELSGVLRTPVPDVSALSLPRATPTAEPFPFVADDGELLVVYFGYTACPDICPTTLADVKAALKQLGAPADKVSIAMATIDPRRDTAEVISGYLQSFFPDATALRTEDDAALRAVTDAFGASYEVAYPRNAEPEVSHSAYLYVVDDTGHIILQWPFGTTANDIALDLGQLLTTTGESS